MTMTKAQKIKKLKAQKPGLYRNINLKKLGAGKTKKTILRINTTGIWYLVDQDLLTEISSTKKANSF